MYGQMFYQSRHRQDTKTNTVIRTLAPAPEGPVSHPESATRGPLPCHPTTQTVLQPHCLHLPMATAEAECTRHFSHAPLPQLPQHSSPCRLIEIPCPRPRDLRRRQQHPGAVRAEAREAPLWRMQSVARPVHTVFVGMCVRMHTMTNLRMLTTAQAAYAVCVCDVVPPELAAPIHECAASTFALFLRARSQSMAHRPRLAVSDPMHGHSRACVPPRCSAMPPRPMTRCVCRRRSSDWRKQWVEWSRRAAQIQ